MDDTRTVRRRDIIIHEDAEGVRGVFEIREDRFVVEADEIVAFAFHQDRVFFRLAIIGRNTFFCKDIGVIRVAILEEAVIDVRTDADGEIFRQRPRRGRPDADVGGDVRRNVEFGIREFHADGDGWILHVFIVLVGLEIGERRRELPAVRHDAVRLIDAALVPKLFEDPPDGFHVGGIHGLVTVFEIDPTAHAVDGLLPFVDICQNHGTAFFIEDINAGLHDGVGARKTEFILRKCFDWKTMAVPTECAFDVFAAHRLIARNDVFNRSREQMTVMGQAGREGRSVIENERPGVLTLIE